MSKKLLKIIVLLVMIFSFSVNAVDYRKGWSIEVGAGKIVTASDNRNKNFILLK